MASASVYRATVLNYNLYINVGLVKPLAGSPLVCQAASVLDQYPQGKERTNILPGRFLLPVLLPRLVFRLNSEIFGSSGPLWCFSRNKCVLCNLTKDGLVLHALQSTPTWPVGCNPACPEAKTFENNKFPSKVSLGLRGLPQFERQPQLERQPRSFPPNVFPFLGRGTFCNLLFFFFFN